MSTAALNYPSVPGTGFSRTLRIFVNEARYEFLRALRTRAFSLSVIGFPVMFYTLFGLVMNRGNMSHGVLIAKYMLGGYAVFGVMGASLFGVGVGLANELSAGWLELKRASPMPPLAYLAAKCLSAMAFGVIIVSLLCVLGITAGHVHLSLSEYLRVIAIAIVGAVPAASMGLVLALLAPATSAPGIANMIYLPMSFMSGLWLPISMLPKVLQKIAPLLPAYHLAQLTLASFGPDFHDDASMTSHWLALAAFTIVMLAVAVIVFRRREQNA